LGHAHTVIETEGRRAATEANGARFSQHLSGQRQTRDQWLLSCGQTEEVRAPLFGRRSSHRFNRRFRLHDMLPRLLRAVIAYSPCAEPLLRQACHFLS